MRYIAISAIKKLRSVTVKKKISIRIEIEELNKLKKTLGLFEDGKCIRAAINFTNNVSHRLFGGNIQNMFKRKKKNEELNLYESEI